MNKNYGFSLIGTLVGAVVFTMVLGGSSKFVEITLQASNASKAVLTENDFKQTIAQGLISKGCHSNKNEAELKSDKLITDATVPGSDPDNGIGALKTGFKLPGGIQPGQDFKGSIEVVKMELRRVATTTDKRNFIVYYKLKGLGNLNARDPLKCTNTDVTGCFEHSCQVTYDQTDKHCKSSDSCQVFAGGGGGGPPPCYQADDDLNTAKTLVGCGGANESAGQNTVAIGYGAGKANTGSGNTAIGYGAGKANTTGSNNTFIGNLAGQNVTTGSNNIAIGSNVQLAPTDSNKINIGKIIKAEQKAVDPNDATKGKMGVLKICNAAGTKCLDLSKQSFTCPDKNGKPQYFRGFDDDGNPVCRVESFCPQSLIRWRPENICHKCPRASPLHIPNQQPPNNCRSCAPGSLYILTGTHKNQCISSCPSTARHYYNSICNKCHQGRRYEYNNRCNICPQEKQYYYKKPGDYYKKCYRCQKNSPCCKTPAHYYNSQCNQCLRNEVYSNDNCCPTATPHYYTGECHKCRSDQVVSHGHCCDSETPYYHTGQCNKCSIPGQKFIGGQCKSCPLPRQWVGNTCRCPQGKHYDKGVCCDQGWSKTSYGNRCCPNNYGDLWGYCCPNSGRTVHFKGGYACCPKNQRIISDTPKMDFCCPGSRTFLVYDPRNETRKCCRGTIQNCIPGTLPFQGIQSRPGQ